MHDGGQVRGVGERRGRSLYMFGQRGRQLAVGGGVLGFAELAPEEVDVGLGRAVAFEVILD